jgi:uncharacterized repeat protein (TIGR03803 family)
MLRKIFLRKGSATLVLLFFGVLLGGAWARTESVLYSFCAQTNCIDGDEPVAGLVFDQKGNLYGTTTLGGTHGSGVVFKLTPKGKEIVLHTFCEQGGNCADGQWPLGGLVFDLKGNLYGTTESGGAHSGGVVFKLTPEGRYIVLYSFCAQTNCTDGDEPVAGVVFDQKGNLYGTTLYGGGQLCCGVVFRLTPEGKEEVLHSFCAQTNCTDGALPSGGLIFDQKGNLYGTTSGGGPYNPSACTGEHGYYGCGIVFTLTPKGKETVLYNFCVRTNCTDGEMPYAGLVFDQKGNLYGTTLFGGAYSGGAVFKLTPGGKETVLYSFCQEGYPCADGENPYATLLFDQKGNLFGTTYYGGTFNSSWCLYGCGIVFKLTPKGKETVLYNFCAQGGYNCTDGRHPDAGLVFDQTGNLYGTTVAGGADYESCGSGCGVVFKLTP